MKALFLIISFALTANLAIGQEKTSNVKSELIQCIDSMEAFWNKGDLDNYMNYYHKSDSLVMQSSNARFYGWERINAMFVNMFMDENLRGELKFTEVEIPESTNELGLVIGKFNLKYPDGNSRDGYFTVLFKKFPEGWKIIHDQS